MTSGLRIAHDLVVAMDYGQFMIRGGQAGQLTDERTLLSEAQATGDGVAADGQTVLVRTSRRFDSAMALRVEVWAAAPADDLAGWQEAFASELGVGPEGTLRFHSPTMTPVECAVPPGRYQVQIAGHPIVTPGSVGGADSWRVRLWPTNGDTVTRRLRSADPSWQPSAIATSHRRWALDEVWTARLRAELLDRAPAGECCRRAEATALLRLTPDLPDRRAQLARRLETLLGTRAALPDLPAELGLVNASGVAVRGLPPVLTAARRCCVAAVWRGALSACGELVTRAEHMRVLMRCEAVEPVLALAGLGRRIGIADPVVREDLGLHIEDGPALLEILGADRTVTEWRTQND